MAVLLQQAEESRAAKAISSLDLIPSLFLALQMDVRNCGNCTACGL
jgi:hypothetical protein